MAPVGGTTTDGDKRGSVVTPSRRPAVALALLVWAAAVAPGIWHLRTTSWPYDLDGFRDIATAQSLADGGGETLSIEAKQAGIRP